jgi:perosamine synthetase
MILLSGPNVSGNEWKYVKECLDTAWVSSVGAYVDKFEQMVAEYSGTKYAVAASNGTSALHIALELLGVKRNDYVITQNVTFIATVNAICYTKARPILMDVDTKNWQMDLDLLEEFLQNETYIKGDYSYLKKDNKRIPVIMPVHVLGNMGDMDRLLAIAERHKLTVVEDSTEALGSYYKGKHAGSFGKLGTFSFNGNKIITTGGGGMIVTDDEALAKKAKHITTQAKCDPFEYLHDEIGYNYRLVNVLAAMGVAQMEQLPGFVKRKHEIDAFYKSQFAGLGDITFQEVSADVHPNCWLFTFKTAKQKELLKALNDKKMQSRPFWVPMNQLKMFKKDLYVTKEDKAGQIYSTCLSIPCSTYITNEELQSIADTVKSCF